MPINAGVNIPLCMYVAKTGKKMKAKVKIDETHG